MDTRDPKSNASGTNGELGRHQRVLDAYLAHSGNEPLPPPSLDAKLLALASSAVKAGSTGLTETDFTRIGAGLLNERLRKANTRSSRRRWPYALAASVATIGFAAILARTGLLEAPGQPSYQTGSYEAQSVAQEQAAVDAAAAMADATATDAQAAASEAPGLPSDAIPLESREQITAAAAPSAAASEDKTKQNSVADAEFERSDRATRGRVAATQSNAVAPEPDFGASSLDAAAPADIAATTNTADSVEKAFAPPAAVSAEPALASAAEPRRDANSSPDAMAATELAEVLVQGSDARNRRAELDAAAPVESSQAQSASASADASASAPASAPAAPPKASADGGSVTGAVVLEQKPAPVAEPTTLANSKKDEFADAAQPGAVNSHAKAYAAIRALRDSGKTVSAQAMLARFVKAYPAVELPADLKVLEKTGN